MGRVGTALFPWGLGSDKGDAENMSARRTVTTMNTGTSEYLGP